ncbi:MAG: RpiB/LacA/LacB family sugar-phosphate isomerase [Anaerolineae bacterium]|nr:RpiB/LacA/LacB family sugar-phosphate isomerase [Anaerolineae bacterium]NUQ05227.1 RpiB/LacA/LacB family sugar-phosphate isomerase [Anaerolineae bacterium]
MKIAMASDHAGFPVKDHLVRFLQQHGHEVIDLGTDSPDRRVDYPVTAQSVADALLDGRAERGILLCGSGVGVSIAANKIPGIYAAICHDIHSAHQGVEHDFMNVMVLGARIIGPAIAEELATAFINAQPFTEERYARRFQMVQALEHKAAEQRTGSEQDE